MTQSNETKLINLENLFENKIFDIPDYQRGYAWSESQIEDLKNDILNLKNKNYMHFTGTIVAKKIEKGNYEIIDGQQRITTLIILIAAAIRSKKLNDDFSEYLKSQFLQRGKPGNEKPVLKPNSQVHDYFIELVLRDQKPYKELKSHYRIKAAYEYFQSWFEEEDVNVKEIVDLAINNLGVIFFVPSTDEEVGIMFEVINNRGKSLSQLEKLKNYLMYYSSINGFDTLRKDIDKKWLNILKNLSHADIHSAEAENSFLRNCYLVFENVSKKDSWDIYEQVKEQVSLSGDNLEKIKSFINFISKCSEYYKSLFDQSAVIDTNPKNRINIYLQRIRCQPLKASIMPLFLAIMDFNYESDDEQKKKVDLLHKLEILNFRVYILPKVTSRSDTDQARLFRWAHKFHVGEITLLELADKLISFTNEHCNEQRFVQSLTVDKDESENYAKWDGIRFLLASYENDLASKDGRSFSLDNILRKRKHSKNNDYLSIEHIWAVKHRSDDYSEKYIEKRRLGNLVLMGLRSNIQKSKLSIRKKVDLIINSNEKLYQIHELKKVFDEAEKLVSDKYQRKTKNYYRDLSKLINDERESRLIDFALKRWKFENEKFERFIRVDSFKTEKLNESYLLKETK